jgi:hypothetical protein
MSYTRRYHETVSKTVSVDVSYPASEQGGRVSRSVTVDIPVSVNIYVDTDPFDRSIEGCNTSVNTLTGAVVATETAQIASVEAASRKVAGSVIEGFFKTIRFEISSQISELRQTVDAHLAYLNGLAKQIRSRKEQMESDYQRTAERYGKVFDDLNRELSNRIFALDRPAFTFRQQAGEYAKLTAGSALAGTIAVTGAESGSLQARIGTSVTKKHAQDTIRQARLFLVKQKRLQKTVNRSMLHEPVETAKFVPVCFLETQDAGGQTAMSIYQPDYLPEIPAHNLTDGFMAGKWTVLPKERREKIERYFNAEVSRAYSAAGAHSARVKETVRRIADFSTIQSATSKNQ